MKKEILKRLKEAEGYVSGQELCQGLGVSRTAVWKAVRQLEEEGYQIQAVRNKGYRLGSDSDVLSEEELSQVICGEWAGKQLVVLKSVDSTNAEARRLAEQGAAHGTLVLAECQTAGKGRRGRSWESPEGSGIWMSLILRPEFEPIHASMLTLLAAMAVEEGIRRTSGLSCQIKWPNDIVLNGKKVCGILTEMSTEEDSIRYVVVGIGMNVNLESFPEDLRDKATSLLLESGKPIRRTELAAAVLSAWEACYGIFLKTLDFGSLMEEYNKRLVNRGRQVMVLTPGGSWQGDCLGINHEGELLVRKADGTVEAVMSGEVSVRGVYGYV